MHLLHLLAAASPGHDGVFEGFGVSFPAMLAQLVLIVVPVILFCRAAAKVMLHGKGVEVPVWLALCLFVPIIFPILALIYFRDQ